MTIFNPLYARPIWSVSIDGKDLSTVLNPRFMSLSLSETRGNEADQLDIDLTDHDGLLELPDRHAEIRLAIGWSHLGLIDKGTYTVDEVAHRGAPDVVTLRARSADMTGPLRARKERSWHGQTIKSIVNDIALENNLEAVVGETIANIKIQHIDQTDESDMAFLNRIGKRYDTVATVKDGKLLFVPIRGAKSASGKDLPVKILRRSDGDNHEFLKTARDTYTGVRAHWMDPRSARKRSVLTGVIGNAKTLRDTFATEQDALHEAQAEWNRIQRGTATMSFSAAMGLPDLSPQQRVAFQNMKPQISEIEWLIKRIQHSITDSGFTTRLELEQFELPQEQQE